MHLFLKVKLINNRKLFKRL